MRDVLDGHAEEDAVLAEAPLVFISAKKEDYNHALPIYEFLSERRAHVFFGPKSLPALGESDYRKEIDRALDHAEHMIVVTSSIEHVMSPWVEAEWGFFVNEKRAGRKTGNLITVLVGALQANDLPPSLRYYQCISFDPQELNVLFRYVGGRVSEDMPATADTEREARRPPLSPRIDSDEPGIKKLQEKPDRHATIPIVRPKHDRKSQPHSPATLWRWIGTLLSLASLAVVVGLIGVFISRTKYIKTAAHVPINGTAFKLINTLTGPMDRIMSIAFSPDGKTLAGGSWDGSVRLWEVANGSEKLNLKTDILTVMSVAFSPDGKTLAAAASGKSEKVGEVELWNVQTGEMKLRLKRIGGWVTSVAFSTDGETLAIGSWDSTVKLLEAATGDTKRVLTGHKGCVLTLAFSPDDATMASGSSDGTLRLWDVATGVDKQTLTGHTNWVVGVAFSPNKKMIASASGDMTVRLWDAHAGTLLRTLTGHTDGVRSVAFAPDGKCVASGSRDRTIKLWDVETGAARQTLTGHTGEVWSVAFSPDGKIVASGSQDKTVKLWGTSARPREAK